VIQLPDAVGPDPDIVSLETRFNLLLDHARRFEHLCGREQFRRMRKHLGWYCKGFPHAAALRARMFRVSSVHDVESALADYHTPGITANSDVGRESSTGLSDDMSSLASRCG
jgi:tRNA-dihydrouridine synthase